MQNPHNEIGQSSASQVHKSHINDFSDNWSASIWKKNGSKIGTWNFHVFSKYNCKTVPLTNMLTLKYDQKNISIPHAQNKTICVYWNKRVYAWRDELQFIPTLFESVLPIDLILLNKPVYWLICDRQQDRSNQLPIKLKRLLFFF